MASHIEVDVLEFEGLRFRIFVGRLAALSRSKEPEESDDDEVDDMGVEAPIGWVVGVESVGEGSDDGDVDRVGTCLRVVFLSQGIEEISE